MSKRWELRCYLDDGQIAACDVSLEIRPELAAAIGATMESLLKHRLYDGYVAVAHLMQPGGPELPADLAGKVI